MRIHMFWSSNTIKYIQTRLTKNINCKEEEKSILQCIIYYLFATHF